MDSDLTPSTSKYFQILKARRDDLDFLMPQFYNGVTRPMTDGVGGTGAGAMSAALLFSSLANDLFANEPSKVSSTSKMLDAPLEPSSSRYTRLMIQLFAGRLWLLHL